MPTAMMANPTHNSTRLDVVEHNSRPLLVRGAMRKNPEFDPSLCAADGILLQQDGTTLAVTPEIRVYRKHRQARKSITKVANFIAVPMPVGDVCLFVRLSLCHTQ